jgi:divalent metal cation (Fe/Co/Zn/Cd) transporter
LDGVASVLIGLILAVTAMVIMRETKGLLLGESADDDILKAICSIA